MPDRDRVSYRAAARSGLIACALLVSASVHAEQAPSATDQGRPPIAKQQGKPTDNANANKDSTPHVPGDGPGNRFYVEAQCDHGCGYAENDEGWWKKLWTDPTATFTGALAIFTVFLVGVTAYQGCLIRRAERLNLAALRSAQRHSRAAVRTIKTMEDTAERQLRAYLAIATQSDPVGARTGGVAVSEDNITVNLFIKNCGQTPAYDVRDWCNIETVSEPRIGRIPKLKKRSQDVRSILAPGQAFTVGRKKTPGLFGEKATSVAGGHSLIYIYGVITYRDAFSKKRYLKFRYVTNITFGKTEDLMITAGGNEAN